MSIDTAAQISVAAQDAGIAPIVRVPGFQHFHATRALDGGAQGVVVPHVDTPEVAAQMVSNCKYPPVGHRSVTGRLPQIGFEAHPQGEVTRSVNNATLVVVMVETPTAVENVEAIAAVPGGRRTSRRHERSLHRDGHPGGGRGRPHPGDHGAGRRGLPHPWEAPRTGRGLRAAPHGALHPDGDAAHPLRQRHHPDDGGRAGAKHSNARDIAIEGNARVLFPGPRPARRGSTGRWPPGGRWRCRRHPRQRTTRAPSLRIRRRSAPSPLRGSRIPPQPRRPARAA